MKEQKSGAVFPKKHRSIQRGTGVFEKRKDTIYEIRRTKQAVCLSFFMEKSPENGGKLGKVWAFLKYGIFGKSACIFLQGKFVQKIGLYYKCIIAIIQLRSVLHK